MPTDEQPAATVECNGPRDCIGTERGCSHCNPEKFEADRSAATTESRRWWQFWRRREHPFATRYCRECGHDVTSHRRLNLAGGIVASRCFEGLCGCLIERRGLA